jgi:hypothetical protein
MRTTLLLGPPGWNKPAVGVAELVAEKLFQILKYFIRQSVLHGLGIAMNVVGRQVQSMSQV